MGPCSSTPSPPPHQATQGAQSLRGHETEDRITVLDQEKGRPSPEGPQRRKGNVMEWQEGFPEEAALEPVYKGWKALNSLRAGGIFNRVSGKEGALKA